MSLQVCPLSRERRSIVFVHDSPPDFRILDLNCLAPSLCDEKYKHHDPAVMDGATRNLNIIREIQYRAPDIVTFQEVEEAQYRFFREELPDFNGEFVSHAGWRVDGVCILFRKGTFRLLEAEAVRFEPASRQDTYLQGQVLVLEHKTTGNRLILANSHLVFNFSKSALKITQIIRILNRAHALRLKHCLGKPYEIHAKEAPFARVTAYSPEECPLPGILFAGDFNLTPISSLYSWMTTGVLNEAIVSAAMEEFTSRPGLLDAKNNLEDVEQALKSPRKTDTLTHQVGRVLKVDPTKKNRNRLLSGQAFMFASNMSFNELKHAVGYDRAMYTLKQLSSSKVSGLRHPDLGEGSLLLPVPEHVVAPQVSMNYQPESGAQNSIAIVRHWLKSAAPSLDLTLFGNTLVLIKDWPLVLAGNELKLEDFGLDPVNVNWLSNVLRRGDSFCSPVLLTSATALPTSSSPDAEVTEPELTVYQGKQRGTVDYIFYTLENLALVRHLGPPDERLARPYGSIPNQGWPLSDHFSLTADFRFRSEKAAHIVIEAMAGVLSPPSGPVTPDMMLSSCDSPQELILQQAKRKRSAWIAAMSQFNLEEC
eukprot:Protomagalhaensia_sp_Gyna_25__870@NODE_141_length_4923_cov_34_183251_g111_i0_p2_GENE_NODE_141_length_4923_cov_34_183251_g111_i0NODE_141_length_4923_cov_34_183251_g111_i0_p2_ORF_typecomplete_len593_score79_92Exo_endo_phos/PF03372_23/1_8e19_NODE_141_length_4923_cov_34_183251_g111_i030694847